MDTLISRGQGERITDWAKEVRARTRQSKAASQLAQFQPSRYSIQIRLRAGSALLFNAVTRSFCRLNPTDAAQWRIWQEAGVGTSADNPILARMLIANGYLVTYGQDELAQVQQTYFAQRHDRSALALTIAPTMACNLACGYCFQGLNKDLRKLDERVPNAIVDMVKRQTGTLRSLNVTWYGGEPLMAKKEIFALADHLIAHCDRHGIQYSSSIVTNGYFLTPDIARQLWVRRCTSAQVTVDGVEETHDKMRPLTSGRGSFRTIMENLGNVLDETPLGISLRVNVGTRNVGECNDLLDEFDQRGFARRGNFSLYFSPIDAATAESGTAWEEGMTRWAYNEALLALGTRARQLGLSAPIDAPKGIMGMCVAARDNGFVITHNGDVHKCWETAHDPRKRIGTVFDPDSFEASPNTALWRAWSPFESDVCKSCKILPMCGGFCGHRFLYQGVGNDHALPCPDWKWNTAEYLFARAVTLGAAAEDEWLAEEATITALQSGKRHSPESLRQVQTAVLEKVNLVRGEGLDVDYLHHGDGRFYEKGTPTKGVTS